MIIAACPPVEGNPTSGRVRPPRIRTPPGIFASAGCVRNLRYSPWACRSRRHAAPPFPPCLFPCPEPPAPGTADLGPPTQCIALGSPIPSGHRFPSPQASLRPAPSQSGKCRCDPLCPPGRRDPGDRFTPTCVGTMADLHFSLTPPPVHPHVRGDNASGPPVSSGFRGSPPRAWGQCNLGSGIERLRRFTPTCVGTIDRSRRPAGPGPVHPHVRGDNTHVTNSWYCYGGSPPRAWGQCNRLLQTICRTRFTPTCVGTMCYDLEYLGDLAVHPHVRGDNRTA